MTQPDTRPTADSFTEVTTDSRRKRHWCLTADLRGHGGSLRLPGRTGWTLCGGYRSMDQALLDRELELLNAKPVVIADLPPCKQCDKSRIRRMEGRRS